MRIMTSNIWGDYFGNEVWSREPQIYNVYKKYSPDIIGFQEYNSGWYNGELMKKLSDEYVFVGTRIFDNCNYVPIAIKKEHKLHAWGFEYLGNTPDESKSITWAVVSVNGKKFAICNTHFWWMCGLEPEDRKLEESKGQIGKTAFCTPEEHNAIRVSNAIQLTELMRHLEKKYSCPVFAFGDMNTNISSSVFEYYAQNNITHLLDIAKEKDTVSSHHGNPVRGDDGRFHGKTTSNDYTHSIDHIVCTGEGFTVNEYRIVEDQDALDATDHSPVYADIVF